MVSDFYQCSISWSTISDMTNGTTLSNYFEILPSVEWDPSSEGYLYHLGLAQARDRIRKENDMIAATQHFLQRPLNSRHLGHCFKTYYRPRASLSRAQGPLPSLPFP